MSSYFTDWLTRGRHIKRRRAGRRHFGRPAGLRWVARAETAV